MLEDTMVDQDKLGISVIPGSEQDPLTIMLPPLQVENGTSF